MLNGRVKHTILTHSSDRASDSAAAFTFGISESLKEEDKEDRHGKGDTNTRLDTQFRLHTDPGHFANISAR